MDAAPLDPVNPRVRHDAGLRDGGQVALTLRNTGRKNVLVWCCRTELRRMAAVPGAWSRSEKAGITRLVLVRIPGQVALKGPAQFNRPPRRSAAWKITGVKPTSNSQRAVTRPKGPAPMTAMRLPGSGWEGSFSSPSDVGPFHRRRRPKGLPSPPNAVILFPEFSLSGAGRPMRLSDNLVEFLGGPVMILPGTRNAAFVPDIGRAVAVQVVDDGTATRSRP